jgi:hypothetical protein
VGGIKEEIKKYQEKFREYAERIKEGLEGLGKIYTGNGRNTEQTENMEPEMKSPWEKGHKLGCGCPGCTAYRDFHGINENRNSQNSQTKPDLRLASRPKPAEKKRYGEETDSRPCGGKHYRLFHGNDAGMKTVLGNYTNRFNFRTMGY